MAKNLNIDVDFKGQLDAFAGQFRNLDSRDPSSWPLVPRFAVFVALAAACLVALWFAWLADVKEELVQAQASELKLRDEYKVKLAKAVNLEALKKQREQVLQYVTQLEKQLPSKAEMDALLSDINQSGLGRSLQFELFRPGQVVINDYYAELPIALRVTGRYHDMGAFASDIANLSRIVTLNNLVIASAKEGTLTMNVTAKTFRYLDINEINAQRKATAKPKLAK
ncbi:type 4a pilus biogenesis protein PilO [Rhodoferax sp.]|uniref:type 4a pilus biogenesis protein PilO n=1 Tax=Rhodoferax sp. TaxID=50421 RepID=UPI00260C4C2F|nr:type 4a pilus biogenesis protein PilO [Rhodoferax sp.]MDD2919230.1 type 4a pilus biogenesis protein PilO [Rhodoferax sp.]